VLLNAALAKVCTNARLRELGKWLKVKGVNVFSEAMIRLRLINPILNESYNPILNESYNPILNESYNPILNESYNPILNESYNPILNESYNPILKEGS
jgi:hypothetical protein